MKLDNFHLSLSLTHSLDIVLCVAGGLSCLRPNLDFVFKFVLFPFTHDNFLPSPT